MSCRYSIRVLVLVSSLVALGCEETTAPPPITYAYTIFFSDSGPKNYSGAGGGFTSYNATQPPSELWVAEYFLGDSIDVFEFLPSDAECPKPRTLTLGGGALGGTSLASVAVRHKRLGSAAPNPDSSTFIVDTAVDGRVWGHFAVELVPTSPDAVTAKLIGWVNLPEIDRYGIPPHCG